MLKYVFVMGLPRSGTTMIARMLVEHQAMIGGSVYESGFLLNPFDRNRVTESVYYQDLLPRDDLARIAATASDELDFFEKVTIEYAGRTGKQVFVEKTPLHTLYHRELRKKFPEAIFLVLCRDPKAVLYSMVKTRWITLTTQKWGIPGLAYIEAMLRMAEYYEALPELVGYAHTIDYEAIVSGASDPTRLLSNAVGLELDPVVVPTPDSPESLVKDNRFDVDRIKAYRRSLPLAASALASVLFPAAIAKDNAFKRILRTILFLVPQRSLNLRQKRTRLNCGTSGFPRLGSVVGTELRNRVP